MTQRGFRMQRIHSDSHPSGFVYGTVCRVNFWVKMTTALGITQLVIGMACMVFYAVAYLTDKSSSHFLRYVGVGVITGSMILSAGTVGMTASKRKTKCMITSFLILSSLAAVFAMFPMVLGIVGATSSMLDDESLLMPITQLVFATVEIVVATWSIGVCCQALCCPNATFGHVSTRFPTGIGITQFISSGDGQHVILFSSSPTQPATFMYNMPANQAPYMIQQGIPTIQLAAQPGIACATGNNGLCSFLPRLPEGLMTDPPTYQQIPQHASDTEAPLPSEKTPGGPAGPSDDENEDEEKGLLQEAEEPATPPAAPTAAAAPNYEVEDEKAHLLC